MLRKAHRNAEALKKELVSLRPMTSLVEKELAIVTGAIKRETVNWVPMWVDWDNAVRAGASLATAVRAITDAGELLWYVRHDTKKHGYHSSADDPFHAVEQAEDAWNHRRRVRRDWARVEVVRKDLLWGRRKFRVLVQDAYDSALCSLGIQWFLKRMRLSHVDGISGRTAAILMKIEPQLGFVIHQALERETAAVLFPDDPTPGRVDIIPS
ncbi:hypothetical protein [Yoonia litorea]|nr:hypothetical protein [Yoonia litorea]